MNARFVPPHPPRGAGPVPVWRGFFGERGRTAIFGWSQAAFTEWHIRRNVLGYRVHIPLHPDAVQRVLLDNAANYAKPDIVKKILAPMIGRGLLSADGPLWRDQRRIVAASFAPPAIDALAPAFARAARATMADWRAGEMRDMAVQATATTMRIIADTLFAGDPRLASEDAMRHIAAALAGFGEARLQALLRLPLMPLSRKGRAGARGRIYLRTALADIVRDRLAKDDADDFPGRLIHALGARFEAKEAFDIAVDNAATFYLAGHETTANALIWTLYLLSEQQELQEQAAAEARAALATGADGSALLDRLPLLRQILDESLRLYPPAPRFDRQAIAADRLGDVDVAPGDLVSIWPWLIHRHSKLWDDSDAFDPARFEPAAKAKLHRFQYLPFGGGPRVCVGARFSTIEALTILASWLGEWRFRPSGRPVRPAGLVTLRPADGLPLRIERR